jgi:2-polyprenyl-3-methyl-5-hydroxy-6-metoxy-1,4-benzoquinol methylase
MEYIESKDQLRMDGNSEAKIDIIVCVDLLQQAEDASAVLAQIRQLLAPNGMCVMLVSALLAENAECGIEELSEQELALEDVGAIENAAVTWKRFGEEGIRRLYSEKELMESVEKAGFCISVADEEWFGADYYEQCGFGKKAKLYLLTVLAT